jgi:hypothetical protein
MSESLEISREISASGGDWSSVLIADFLHADGGRNVPREGEWANGLLG